MCDVMCDVIKQNESELTNTDFEIQPNKTDNFFVSCYLFVFIFLSFVFILCFLLHSHFIQTRLLLLPLVWH